MKVLSYRLTLEQPLLATQLLGDPNSSVSLDYVPGSLLRGALIARYIRRHPLPDNDVHSDEQCWRLFFSGATRYLHAYPQTGDHRRSLPTPLALLQRKQDVLDFQDPQAQLAVFNASHADANEQGRRVFEDDDSAKQLQAPFCAMGNHRLYLHRVHKQVAVHVLRERAKGRATRAKGAVFQYEALERGQVFAGHILLEHDADEARLRELLDDSLMWLGRSRSANYGRMRIDLDPQARVLGGADGRDWREIGEGAAISASTASVTLTLLSDAILRDPEGHYISMLDHRQQSIDDRILAEYIGVGVQIDPYHTFTGSIQIGGFNNAWQLPLIQVAALKAGSVLVFQPQAPLTLAQMRAIEWQGIGERRVEGFGRVAFGWPNQLELIAKAALPAAGTPIHTPLAPMAQTLAQRMADRLQEQEITQAIVAYVQKHVEATGMPKNSQLGRVRVLARRAMVDGKLDDMLRAFSAFQSTARQQFEHAHLRGVSLWEWLQTLLSRPETVWSTIGLSENGPRKVLDYAAQRDEAITRQTVLRLIDAVLVAPARARREEGQQ